MGSTPAPRQRRDVVEAAAAIASNAEAPGVSFTQRERKPASSAARAVRATHHVVDCGAPLAR